MRATLFLVLLSVGSALANDAAMNDGAQGPQPMGWKSGKESIIQMKEEQLDIHFGYEETKVKVAFTFLSHKTSGPAKQKLGFPNAARSTLDGDISGPIRNLVTKVNGVPVEAELVEGIYREIVDQEGNVTYENPKPGDPEEELRKLAWYVIEVDFPVGKEVVVEREYDCPSGLDTMMNSFFVYETKTGAAWHGDIEKLTATVTFNEDVVIDYVTFTPKQGWKWNSDRTEASLSWTDFEPRTDEDRRYFEISALDIPKIKEALKEPNDSFPSLEQWIKTWKENLEFR